MPTTDAPASPHTGPLLGLQELQRHLGLPTRQAAYQQTRRPGFPAPHDELATGRVWRTADVDAWQATRVRGGRQRAA